MSTNRLNDEEALEENMRAGRGCLFLRCSSKQTTSRGGVKPLSTGLATRVAKHGRIDDIAKHAVPVLFRERESIRLFCKKQFRSAESMLLA
jgi:hypothetical protein